MHRGIDIDIAHCHDWEIHTSIFILFLQLFCSPVISNLKKGKDLLHIERDNWDIAYHVQRDRDLAMIETFWDFQWNI